MIGEVSPAEIEDLRQHLSECAACGEQYREFTQFLLPQLSISSDNEAAFETGYSVEDRERLRREFLAAAQKRGRVFSDDAVRDNEPAPASPANATVPIRTSPARTFRPYRWALAASIAIGIFGGGYGTHVLLVGRHPVSSAHSPIPAELVSAPLSSNPDAESAITELRAANERDRKTIADLEQKLATTVVQLEDAQRSLQVAQNGQSTLQAQLTEKTSLIMTLQSQTQGDQQAMNDLRGQVTQLQRQVTDGQSTIAANELRVRDLNEQLGSQTASLSREREMLSVGRDVRDLMGARNLHIIDVHDANGAGKNQRSFGRIFYTEGKQLIFYAFDLDNKRVVNASYSFEAWGERLGQPSSVKSLGLLYVDDKEQRRWSLKVDDPRQLAEINSVFVTLEPHGGEKERPEGKRILFAFLGGEPNHP